MIDFPNWGQPILSVTNLSIGKACFILSLIFQPLWKRYITCQTADYTSTAGDKADFCDDLVCDAQISSEHGLLNCSF